ncbi:MAG: PilW family protein [Gemmataceae bacterium]
MMPSRHHKSTARLGFTLVEMLVATALIIFVMLILTTVFTAGLQALRNMRGIGSMQDNLRQAATILRRDLAQQHFSSEQSSTAGPTLSQQRLDLYDWKPPKQGFFRIWQGLPAFPEGGWNTTTGLPNNRDGDGQPSFVMDAFGLDPNIANQALSGYQYLHFTVRNEPGSGEGTGRDRYTSTSSFFSAGLSPASLNAITALTKPEYLRFDSVVYSPWAEIAYFVQPTGQSAGSMPLYTFYRRRRLAIDAPLLNPLEPRPPSAPTSGVPVNYAQSLVLSDVSLAQPPAQPLTSGQSYAINSAYDVTMPYRRFGMGPVAGVGAAPRLAGVIAQDPTQSFQYSAHSFYPLDPNDPNNGGDDVLLENVVSFDIRATWDVPTDSRIDRRTSGVTLPRPFVPTGPTKDYPAGSLQPNMDYPFDDLPVTPINFGNDTIRTLNPAGQPSPRVFDTWSLWRGDQSQASTYDHSLDRYEQGTSATVQSGVEIPLRIRVKAIQIRLRVWDTKTQQTRQITIVQDL